MVEAPGGYRKPRYRAPGELTIGHTGLRGKVRKPNLPLIPGFGGRTTSATRPRLCNQKLHLHVIRTARHRKAAPAPHNASFITAETLCSRNFALWRGVY